MHRETARRGRLLYVALAFLGLDLPPAVQPSGLRALHARCLARHRPDLRMGWRARIVISRSHATVTAGARRCS